MQMTHFEDFNVPEIFKTSEMLKPDYEVADARALAVYNFLNGDGLVYIDHLNPNDSAHKEARRNGDNMRFEFVQTGMGLDWFGSEDEVEFYTWLENRARFLAIQQIRELISDKEQIIKEMKQTVDLLESL